VASLRQSRVFSRCDFSFFRSSRSHFVAWLHPIKWVECDHAFSRNWPCCELFAVNLGLSVSFDHSDNSLLIQSQLGDDRSLLSASRCEVVLLGLKKPAGLVLLNNRLFLLGLFLKHTATFSIVYDKVFLVSLQHTQAYVIIHFSPLVDGVLDV